MYNFIPLLSVKIGSRRYNSKSSWDITITYDERICCLCIRVQAKGESGEPKGSYVINGVSGEALFLHSVTGSLEQMIVKVLLETTHPVRFESNSTEEHVRCNIITMEANVEQAGSIRELLMKLRSESLSLTRDVRIYEGIPQWSLLLPWWLYSKRIRIIIQQVLILYAFFNTFWALWQLYRHVDMIRDTVEPVIILLQETCHVYISFAMEAINTAMEHFSNYWWRFFAPLKVLVEPLWDLDPLVKFMTLLYSIFSQVLFPMLSLIITVSLATTSLLWYMVSTLLRPISWLLLVIFSYILRPLFTIIQCIPGLARTTVDPVKLLVRSLLLNSFKSMCKLLLWITRLTRIYKHSEKPLPSTDREVRLERRHTTEF